MASMDNSAAAKLLQRPPSPQAAELPTAPPPEGGGRRLGKLSRRTRLLAVAAILLVLDYFQVILKNLDETIDEPGDPLPWRLLAAGGVVLAYAALIWFLRRLERRRLPDDDHDARWEKGVKIAAHILDYPIFSVLGFYLGAMTPLALFIFVWVGSCDHAYLGIVVHEDGAAAASGEGSRLLVADQPTMPSYSVGVDNRRLHLLINVMTLCTMAVMLLMVWPILGFDVHV